MKKLICVLCALVMALLPVLVMAEAEFHVAVEEETNSNWKFMETIFLDTVLDNPFEIWKDEELGGGIIAITNIELTLQDKALGGGLGSNNCYIGYSENCLYLVVQRDSEKMYIVEFDRQYSMCMYQERSCDETTDYGKICEEFCGANYWKVEPKAVQAGFYKFMNN